MSMPVGPTFSIRKAGLPLAAVVVAAIAMWSALKAGIAPRDGELGQGLFPFLLALIMMASGIALAARSVRRPDGDAGQGPNPVGRQTLLMVGIAIAFAVLIPLIGFVPASVLCVVALVGLWARYPWHVALVVALGVWAVLEIVFVRLLQVALP